MKKHIAAGLALSGAILLMTAAPASAEETHWHGTVNVVVHPDLDGDGAGDEIQLGETSVTTSCGNEVRATLCDGLSWSGGATADVLGTPIATVTTDAEKHDGPADHGEYDDTEETDLPDPL